MMHSFTNVKYLAEATATDGRAGRVSLTDGVLDVELGEFGTSVTPQANPESLFAAALAASFHSALVDHAKQLGFDAADSMVTSGVSLGAAGEKGDSLAVRLKVALPGVKESTAQKLVALARESCPYCKAIRGNVELLVTIS